MVMKPSDKEQEYFLKIEAERIRELQQEHAKKIAEEERERLRKLHFMHCPKCGMDLTSSHFSGVEIDVCPDCGGLFLDAGELDKILEEKRRGTVFNTIAAVRRLIRG